MYILPFKISCYKLYYNKDNNIHNNITDYINYELPFECNNDFNKHIRYCSTYKCDFNSMIMSKGIIFDSFLLFNLSLLSGSFDNVSCAN